MRIPTLLEKINSLASQPETRTAIDVDLMLDYTRVLYADLLEWRARMVASPTGVVNPAGERQTFSKPKEVFQEAISENQAVAIEAKKTIADPHLRNESATLPGWKTATQDTKVPGKDIRSLIGINDKYQILSELFGNDKQAYEEALDFINQSEAEAAAMNWLREQLWITEERSDAAQNFFELVNRHFGS